LANLPNAVNLPAMTKSLFITLEGGEGTGKTTLIKSLYAELSLRGHEIVLSREPGGTEGAEAIRDLVLKGDANRWNSMSEICLYYAAREDHLMRVIRPALLSGKIVICDRFYDSTRAYQGHLGPKEQRVIKCLEDNIVAEYKPDLTIILDIDVEIGLARAGSRKDDECRFESKKLEYHQNLRNAFLAIAKTEPERCKLIDAAMPIAEVYKSALALIDTALKART